MYVWLRMYEHTYGQYVYVRVYVSICMYVRMYVCIATNLGNEKETSIRDCVQLILESDCSVKAS